MLGQDIKTWYFSNIFLLQYAFLSSAEIGILQTKNWPNSIYGYTRWTQILHRYDNIYTIIEENSTSSPIFQL